jgi:hypothetical protein
MDVSFVPRALVGAVNGVEIVAVTTLQLARDVLLTAVSGAANIGAEALTATTAGARGVVSATSEMIGDIAGTAGNAFREALNARYSRPGGARVALRRPAVTTKEDQEETTAPTSPPAAAGSRRGSRRQRSAAPEIAA